jgi:hypothetical protein
LRRSPGARRGVHLLPRVRLLSLRVGYFAAEEDALDAGRGLKL